uniref:hypothetical protein n=1 Tax=Solidesulfovibrio sp. TaxID=2910990 RepID=UPI0026172D21
DWLGYASGVDENVRLADSHWAPEVKRYLAAMRQRGEKPTRAWYGHGMEQKGRSRREKRH